MVQNGAILTYVGTWYAGGVFQTVNDLVSAISQDILIQGLAVRSSSVNQSFGQLIGSAGWGGGFSVTMQVQVENGLGYASTDDVISIIRGAVYQESGAYPTGDSIPYDQEPGQATTTTGQPTGTLSLSSPGQQGCIAGTSNDLTGNFSLGCWFSNLTTAGLSTVGVLVIIGIVGLILLSKGERALS